MMIRTLFKTLDVFRRSRFAGDVRGNAILEFAICGSAFIALLLAATQVALVYFAGQGIQTAAELTARKILTGQALSAGMTQAQMKAEACANLPKYLRCSKLLVDVRGADSFNAIDTSKMVLTYDSAGNVTNQFRYDIGSGESIVILRLMYVWTVPTGPLGLNISNQANGVRLITGTMVFKSEPFAA